MGQAISRDSLLDCLCPQMNNVKAEISDNPFLLAFFGKQKAPVVTQLIQYRLEGVYAKNTNSFLFRSLEKRFLYNNIVADLLKQLSAFSVYDLSSSEIVEQYLTQPELFRSSIIYNESVLALMIARELDQENKIAVEYLKKAVNDPTGEISDPSIAAIFYSHRQEYWKAAADLLAHAQLQEGLRRSIMYFCFTGNYTATRFMIDFLYSHSELIRFPAISSKIAELSGLSSSLLKKFPSQKILKMIHTRFFPECNISDPVNSISDPINSADSVYPANENVHSNFTQSSINFTQSSINASRSASPFFKINDPMECWFDFISAGFENIDGIGDQMLAFLDDETVSENHFNSKSDDSSFIAIKELIAWFLVRLECPIPLKTIIDLVEKNKDIGAVASILFYCDLIEHQNTNCTLTPKTTSITETNLKRTNSSEERALYFRLRDLLLSLPKKKIKAINPLILPPFNSGNTMCGWKILGDLVTKMLLPDIELINNFIELFPQLPTEAREFVISRYLVFCPARQANNLSSCELNDNNNLLLHTVFSQSDIARRVLFAALSDKSKTVQSDALKIISQFDSISEEELLQIRALANSKNQELADLSAQTFEYFKNYQSEQVITSENKAEESRTKEKIIIENKTNNNENKKDNNDNVIDPNKTCENKINVDKSGTKFQNDIPISARPLKETSATVLYQKNPSFPDDLTSNKIALNNRCSDDSDPSDKIHIPIDREHGYGLYDRSKIWIPDISDHFDPEYHPRRIIQHNKDRALDLIQKLNQFIVDNRERDVDAGGGEILTFGQYLRKKYRSSFTPMNFYFKESSDDLLLPDLWNTFFEAGNYNYEEILTAQLILMINTGLGYEDYMIEFYGPRVEFVLRSLYSVCFVNTLLMDRLARFGKEKNAKIFEKILFAIAGGTPRNFWDRTWKRYDKEEPVVTEPRIAVWYCVLDDIRTTPEVFLRRWFLAVNVSPVYDAFFRTGPNQILDFKDLLAAYDRGQIDESSVLFYLFDHKNFNFSRDEKICLNHPLVRKGIKTIVDQELIRQEDSAAFPGTLFGNTLVFHHPAMEGVDYFVQFLHRLEKKPLKWSGSFDNSSGEAFLILLAYSRPASDETVETLCNTLNRMKVNPVNSTIVSRDRLLEVAFFAPYWQDLIGEYLKINDLPGIIRWFYAHAGTELLPQSEEITLSRWSNLSKEDFNSGAFDCLWLDSIIKSIGPDLFQEMTILAKKFATPQGNRRVQICLNAIFNRLTEEEMEEKILHNRDKDFVRAYGLLPHGNLIHRWEILQEFLKGTRKFGSQRQISEKSAGNIAIGNLARKEGFTEVNRFVWKMELAQWDRLQRFFQACPIGEYSVTLKIDPDGLAGMEIRNQEKILKSAPSKIKKDTAFLEISEAIQKLRDQRARSIRTFESLMEHRGSFTRDELTSLVKNPILGPLVKKILWQCNGDLGFYDHFETKPNPEQITDPLVNDPFAKDSLKKD